MTKDVLSDAEIEVYALRFGLAAAGNRQFRRRRGEAMTGPEQDKWDALCAMVRNILAAAEPAIRADALEQAAKVCDDKERRKWRILTEGGALEGFGPLDCADAIRQLGAGSKEDAS